MTQNQSKCGCAEKAGAAVENSAAGLNDNLDFMGKRLHIQTEITGVPAPHIITQVFSNGRVLFSKKSGIANGPDLLDYRRIQDLMRIQHLQVIRDIQAKQRKIMDSRQF